MKRLFNHILSALLILSVPAQSQDMKKQLDNYFKSYRAYGQLIRSASKLQSITVNDTLKTIEVCADSHFGEQLFTPKSAEDIYTAVGKLIAPPYKHYRLIVKTGGWDIRQLVPTRLQKNQDPNRLWGNIDYTGRPWVSNASLPYKVTKGLQNRHLSIWASHGRYYDLKEQMWRWQRPALFGTREDLFTQTIVTPYLLPMLEKAGAVVFTPRERDWQDHEASSITTRKRLPTAHDTKKPKASTTGIPPNSQASLSMKAATRRTRIPLRLVRHARLAPSTTLIQRAPSLGIPISLRQVTMLST